GRGSGIGGGGGKAGTGNVCLDRESLTIFRHDFDAVTVAVEASGEALATIGRLESGVDAGHGLFHGSARLDGDVESVAAVEVGAGQAQSDIGSRLCIGAARHGQRADIG